jgi:Uma2 family endonuclease
VIEVLPVEQLKFETYERLGVAEYWIVDPDESSVRIFRRSGERFTRIDAGDTLTTPPPPRLRSAAARSLRVAPMLFPHIFLDSK